jgi:hypothetical protein
MTNTENFEGRQEMTFVRFRNLQELIPPISRESFLEKTGGGAMLARNGKYLSKELVDILL